MEKKGLGFMEKVKDKILDWKNRLQDRHMLTIIVVLFVVCLALGGVIYKKQNDYRQAMENQYNMAFFELVDYVQNVETYLAKAQISTTPDHGAQTLTQLWREANLASSYLAQIPVSTNELANKEKFLNQVSDYSDVYKRQVLEQKI